MCMSQWWVLGVIVCLIVVAVVHVILVSILGRVDQADTSKEDYDPHHEYWRNRD